MKIFIKNLRGDVCVMEVKNDTKISDIKKRLENDMKVPISQQTLVLNGKILHDDKTIGFYPRIKEGSKLYVAIRKPELLDVALDKFLRQYYSEAQTKTIVDYFMKDFQEQVASLSLDDLERIAISDLHYDSNV